MANNFDNDVLSNLALQCFNTCIDRLGAGVGRDLGNRLFIAYSERGLTGLAREFLSKDFDKVRFPICALIASTPGVDFDTLMTRARTATGKHPKHRTAIIVTPNDSQLVVA